MGYRLLTIRASLTQDERDTVIRNFNDSRNPSQVLVTNIVLSGLGINLQHQCHTVIVLEGNGSIPALLQVACRVNRIGQKYRQKVYTLAIDGSYDQFLESKALKKYAGQFFAENVCICQPPPPFLREHHKEAWVTITLEAADLVV
jgi:SNF2 family DNA or RNA helicase